MTLCRGCDARDASGNSHIIPESFFRHMRGGSSQPLQEISREKNSYPKRRPIGYYDPNILCNECEKFFGPYDDFGQNVLIKRAHDFKLKYDGKVYQLDKVDGKKFKKFLVSVMWRASVSNLDTFSAVNLGRYELVAKKYLWGDSIDSIGQFDFIGFKTDEVIFRAPAQLRNSGVNFVCLYFPGGYSFWIKVGRRPMPRKLLSQRLGKMLNIVKTDNLFLFAREIHSKESEILDKAIRNTRFKGSK